MDKYNTLQECITAEIDILEDDYEFSMKEYEAMKNWYFDKGFSDADREFALGRSYDENIEYWEAVKNGTDL